MVLVGAQNGTGKTSLLVALYLGLFGREAMHLIEGITKPADDEERSKSYKALLERTIFRPALEDEEPSAFVRLTFDRRGGDRVVVSRRWSFSRRGTVRDLATPEGEEVRVEHGGFRKVYRSWTEANEKIAELLFPSNVMPCFFFDGEQAQERVVAAREGALVSAVNTLYGTGLLDQLRQSLSTWIGNERASMTREYGNIRADDLDEKQEQLETLKGEQQEVQAKLNDKRLEKDELEGERHRAMAELTQLAGAHAADIEDAASTLDALREEQNSLRRQLADGLGSAALPLALHRVGGHVVDTLDGEVLRDRWLLLKSEASGKAESIVDSVFGSDSTVSHIDPPLTGDQVAALRERLEHALEALWSPPPDGCADSFNLTFLSPSDRPSVRAKLERLRSLTADLVGTAEKWRTVSRRLSETTRRFENLKDLQPKLQSLKERIGSLSDKLTTCETELNGLMFRDDGLQVRIRDLKGAIGQLEKRRSAVDPIRAKLEAAYHVRSVLEEAGEKLLPLCKSELKRDARIIFDR